MNKHNTSIRRQNELIGDLIEFARQRETRQQTLEQTFREASQTFQTQFAGKRQEVTTSLLSQHDQLEAEYQAKLQSARDELDAQRRIANNEHEEKITAAAQQAKSERSDGEYDWFLSKQRVQKEFDADKLSTREAYKVTKAKLKEHGEDYNELASLAKATLARHQCELKVQGGDLLEDPGPGNHLQSHLQTSQQVGELIRQFRKTFWVRFQEDRWFLIVFLLAAVIVAYPLYLVLSNAAFAGIASAIIGIISSVVAYFVSRSLASKTAQQFRDSFASAITAGKEQLLASQFQNKKDRERQLARLETEATQRSDELDTNWADLQSKIETRRTQREQELNEWVAKRSNAIEQQREAQENTLAKHYQPKLAELQATLQESKQQLAASESEHLSGSRSEYESQLNDLAVEWKQRVQQATEEVQGMQQTTRSSLVDFTQNFDRWSPPTAPLDAVQLGQVQIKLDEITKAAEDRRFQVESQEFNLPTSLDLVHSPSLLIESTSQGRSDATQLIKSAMLRLLTSIPPGKLRFTIIDPVGLGQDFSAFMHLGDYDEQLINHRIWTESNHINARLMDLTQHMENIIQTYLRNEFSTIQEYNQNAGEVAEAFRVLVVANFPTGFSDEATRRLLSIVSSGPRCGVYTLMSVDSQQSMPRNFDLDDLRQNANVLVADNNEVRPAEPPLSSYPIQLESLPSEDKFSEVMHAIGSKAKDASRVEVPFSAVAPPEADWWHGDSRSEIDVNLGRAGATKFQSMTLGHGTSQHVLISGKTGSGKSTLLHAMITNLALKYSPSEVQFYLIDFKKGVEFKAYAEHKLPHARVIAIESEREFGQSVLQRLDAELRRRGDLFRRVGVQGLAGYRDARPEEHMPRILLVIDEFQEFFIKEDKVAQEASLLLDRLVRQGRAFGIHVLLGSQTLAGAYSLARATIGQMAVRIALQCSATDAHLILSDDNDAARLLRRPGEAIYNDANGMVEGNHPFQVVWLSDVEKENYLRQLADRYTATETSPEPTIVFEGNVAANAENNELLRKSWESPAPSDIPLAPRAWLGEAIAIKEPPAAIFHRRSGANLLLCGQQEEPALGIMATSLLSLAAFSPSNAEKQSRLVVLDGTRPESEEAGYWTRLKETSGLEIDIVKPRDGAEAIRELSELVAKRHEADDDEGAATFLFVYNLARFRELQKTEDDFGFGGFGEEQSSSPAEQLANILREGPLRGVHSIVWSDTHTNLMRWIDRQSLRDIEGRVLFQMSATDSSNLMDSSAAAQLGQCRAIYYSEDQGRAERFRPYGLPTDDFLLKVRSMHTSPTRTASPADQ